MQHVRHEGRVKDYPEEPCRLREARMTQPLASRCSGKASGMFFR